MANHNLIPRELMSDHLCVQEDKSLQEVLKSETDLREYSIEVEKELLSTNILLINHYIEESDNIAKLHNQIESCDKILQNMECLLSNFQKVLSNISSEITFLQKKSVMMSQQLSNRLLIKNQLYQFVEDLAIPEEMIQCIMESPVTEKNFLIHLNELNHKLSMVKELSFEESKSAEDVGEILEKLKIKAVAKLRAYLLEQIYKFRIPMTNYQLPQNSMLKYKFFFEFILSNQRQVAQEICTEYVDTMSKIYYSYFKSYALRLAGLRYEEAITKDDLMGIEDSGNKGLFARSTTLKNKSTIFTIGNRGDILTSELEAPIIIPNNNHQKIKKYPYEALFRSEQYALVDNACREYLFIIEFYLVRGNQSQELFNQIMGKTMSLMVKNLETYVSESYDAIALFLCIQLILRYQILCHKRCVNALDKYWDTLQSCLWPRFEFVFRLNIQSIRDSDPTKFSKETGPHYITRRYAEFSAALVGITENFPNETVSRLLLELKNEVECFLLRMAAIFSQRKEQLIYLINNYDLILSILMERTRDNTKETESFREQLNTKSNEYVEEMLNPHIGGIIHFIKECEKENVCKSFFYKFLNVFFTIFIFHCRAKIIKNMKDGL